MSNEDYKEIIIELIKNMTDNETLRSLFYIIQKIVGRGY
jgi:hypothetical protein